MEKRNPLSQTDGPSRSTSNDKTQDEFIPSWICPVIGISENSVAQLVLWNRSAEEQRVEVSISTADGEPVTMDWSPGITGATASVILPPHTPSCLTAKAVQRRKANLSWARITAPASGFTGFGAIEIETSAEHWSATVAFVRDDQTEVIVPIVCTGRIQCSYFFVNTLPSGEEETRAFEIVFHMAESGTRTIRRVERSGRGVISLHAPILLDPPDVGFIEVRALDGKAGFFVAATYLTNSNRGIFRAL